MLVSVKVLQDYSTNLYFKWFCGFSLMNEYAHFSMLSDPPLDLILSSHNFNRKLRSCSVTFIKAVGFQSHENHPQLLAHR